MSAEDQARANERVPDLLATPAAVRWLSCEPLLGPVDLSRVFASKDEHGTYLNDAAILGLDWIVAGGESGAGARPMPPDWPRSLRDQCAAAGVPFIFKQWGNHRPTSDCQHGEYMIPATKQEASRKLDGQLHDAMPERAG